MNNVKKDIQYYKSKYKNRLDEIYCELADLNVKDIDYTCTMEFDETANAEEVVGYYLTHYDKHAFETWMENIKYIELTGQDKEITRIFEELKVYQTEDLLLTTT